MLAALLEHKPRTGDEISNGAGHEDFAGVSLRRRPRADRDRNAAELAVDALALARVDTSSYLEAEIP